MREQRTRGGRETGEEKGEKGWRRDGSDRDEEMKDTHTWVGK